MDGYWIPIILGALTPWIIMPRYLVVAFQRGGMTEGFGAWFGMSLLTIPIIFLITFTALFVMGY